MKLPPEPSPLQPLPGTLPALSNGVQPQVASFAKSASVALGDQHKMAQPLRVFPASPSKLQGGQGSVANVDAAVRVSVIDGGDRMVYSDVRDRRGWAQPLAVNEAVREAGQRSGARDVPSSPQPRVVRELEQRPSSPYQIGKASVQSLALNTSGRTEAKMPRASMATHQPATGSRSR